jgi:MFS transporter, DHA1 family, multidrug resistance protein
VRSLYICLRDSAYGVLLSYLQDCYPRYVASILAGNDFFRACLGAGFPLFSTGALSVVFSYIGDIDSLLAFFSNLGVGPACSLLGGLTCLMLPIPWLLWKYGDRIRARSPNCGL